MFGIKPTFGLVPAYPPSPMGLLSHHGPIARSVADAAAMLDVIGRPDPRDPYWLPAPSGSFLDGIEGGVRGWKIAFSPDLGYAKVDPEIAASVAAAARRFEELGARVELVGKIFDSPRETLLTRWSAGAARIVAGIPAEKLRQCDPGFIAVAAAGAGIGAVDDLGADLQRTALGRTMGAFHETYDLLLTPMMPVPALPVSEDLNDPASERHWVDWSPFSYPFNITRQPAASIPCGLTSGGLPIRVARSSAGCTTTPGLLRAAPRLRGDAAAQRRPPGLRRMAMSEPNIVLTDTATPRGAGGHQRRAARLQHQPSRVRRLQAPRHLRHRCGRRRDRRRHLWRQLYGPDVDRARLSAGIAAPLPARQPDHQDGGRRGKAPRLQPGITLNTMEIQAQGFYLKLGFETAAALTCDPPGINRYVMTKKLT